KCVKMCENNEKCVTISFILIVIDIIVIIVGSIVIGLGCNPDSKLGCETSVYTLKDGVLSKITAFKCNDFQCYYTEYLFSYNGFTETCIFVDTSTRYDTSDEAINATTYVLNNQYKILLGGYFPNYDRNKANINSSIDFECTTNLYEHY